MHFYEIQVEKIRTTNMYFLYIATVASLIGSTTGALCRCAVKVEDAVDISVPLESYYQFDIGDVPVCDNEDLKECSDICLDRAIDFPDPFLLDTPSPNSSGKTRGTEYCEKINAMSEADRPDVGVPGLPAASYFMVDDCPETEGYMSTDPAYFRDYLCCDGNTWIDSPECDLLR
ncbi:unnamed protein product [Owenia fusiformis]|uniref:Uncharacterized protein n=1 Tax=Owenia fusiformis TaxID=6347 RepID=A0A8S4Q7P1_OWEFU|nr:unnamed protein product [Owenia fusiformis]